VIAMVYGWRRRQQSSGPNLQNMTIRRLTENGDVSHAAISPDGRYVAYVLQGAKQSIWVRQVAAESAIQVLPPGEEGYAGITFSPDGNYIYVTRERRGGGNNDLYQFPVLGGSPKLIHQDLQGAVALSADGKRIAFLSLPNGGSTLNTANSDGTVERVIAKSTGPVDYFGMLTRPSWSPDGQLVAATSWWRKDGYATAVRCYPVNGGKPIVLPSRKFLHQAVWMHDQSGLLLAVAPAFTKNFLRQIWRQPYPQGEPERITNDLGDYSDLSLTVDDQLLASVEKDVASAVYVGPSLEPDHGVPITTAKSDGFAVAWMPNGRLLLQDGRLQFSLAQADGKNRVSLFEDELGRGGVSVCGDGRFIVFSSKRGGNQASIWRVDSSGRNLKQLTKRNDDAANPHCSADGAWVVYNSMIGDDVHLMKVSIEGGPGVSLTKSSAALGARYSPDAKQVAFYDFENRSRITIISSSGGTPFKTFDLAPGGSLNYWDYSLLHWTPDGQALTYPLLVGDDTNLWSQPIAGGPPRQITHFHDRILAYDWSPDGKRLAITRAKSSSDVVLISDFR
jgi:Tol biopolymer transport system component